MSEYPKAVRDIAGQWYVEWDADNPSSPMPDEATARRCAASGKMLEALRDAADELLGYADHGQSVKAWHIYESSRAAISSATGGE